MGKILRFGRRSYVYLTESEEAMVSLIRDYLKNSPNTTAGMDELRHACERMHKKLYNSNLSQGRFRWGMALLMGVKSPPALQIWQIKRKRYIKLLSKK